MRMISDEEYEKIREWRNEKEDQELREILKTTGLDMWALILILLMFDETSFDQVLQDLIKIAEESEAGDG